jgi:nardilysin
MLEDWVRKLFIKVKAGPPVSIVVEEKLTTFWKRGKQYKLEAVKDVHNLDLSWMLPCLHREYLKKPHCYLSHLLGHGISV